MAKTFTLTLSQVDGPLFQGDAVSVSVPGVAGDMQILAEHAPLISPLKAGEIVIMEASKETNTFTIDSGTLEVSENQVTIIV